MRDRLFLCVVCLLGGCTVGPDYTPPENHVSNDWVSESEERFSQDPTIPDWWTLFQDEFLTRYICLSRENNQDVLTATSNILQARALRQMAASSFYPQIGADVNAIKTYFSKNGPVFAIGPSIGSVPGTVSGLTGLPFALQVPQVQSLYNALFDASWEIDLFGKTRRLVEAADALIGTAIEARHDVLVSVMAEIGSNYMELRSAQKKKQLIEERVGLLEKKAFLIRKQYEAGYVSRLHDEQIQAVLLEEKAKIPTLQAQIYRTVYTLSILIGDVPETLLVELLAAQPLPSVPKSVALGLRSDLLRRRPDIRQKERELAAATAQIGVAVASFFPTFTLVGDGGFQSLLVKNLFSLGSKTWAVGGDVNMPVFEGGRLTGNLQAKRAETAAAAHRYQQTVLQALEETESALAFYTEDEKMIQDKQEVKEKYQELLCLTQARNEKGLVSSIELIESQIRLNLSEESLVNSQSQQLIHLIRLYKALGGGWEESVEQSQP